MPQLPQRTRRSLIGIVLVIAAAIGGRVAVVAWHDRSSQAEATGSANSAAFSLLVAGATGGPVPQHVGRFSMLALGDSYTIGQSIAPPDRWPVQLAKQLRAHQLDVSDPDILARTGWTTADLLAAMQQTKLAATPPPVYDEVLLLIGVNNQFRGYPLDTYRTEFHTLLQRSIQLARGDPRRVVVLSIPDWGATPFGHRAGPTTRITTEIAAFNASAQTLATAAGAAFVDITPASEQATTQPTLVAPDGLHPSAEQYAHWVEQALPAAEAALHPALNAKPTSSP